MYKTKRNGKKRERPLEVRRPLPFQGEEIGQEGWRLETEVEKNQEGGKRRIWVAEGEVERGGGMGMKRLKNAGYVDCCNNSRSAPRTAW